MQHLHDIWNGLDSFWQWSLGVAGTALIGAAVKAAFSRAPKPSSGIRQSQVAGDHSAPVQIGTIEK